MFSWKPIYRELAQALIPFRNRQKELLAIITEMYEAGLLVINLKDVDKDDHKSDLSVIDPFTFFANFNRGTTEDNRKKVIAYLKSKFGLTSPIPEDFNAIPVAHSTKARFFPFAKDRIASDIDALWDLAISCITDPSSVGKAYERCLKIKEVGVAKLTIGMFWLNPDSFIALDSLMAEYIESKGIPKNTLKKCNSYADYVTLVTKIRGSLGADFPQVSWDAYVASNKVTLTTEELDTGLINLLMDLSSSEHCTVEEAVEKISSSHEKQETEASNRIEYLPKIASILLSKPISCAELQSVSNKLWVLKNGNEATRRTTFLKHPNASEIIQALVDENSGIEELARIETFVENAVACGYTDPNGTGEADAAQFASVLLSSLFPDRYVDYRDSRWTKLFQLISKSKKRLYSGSMSTGWKLVSVGKFACALSNTPTFLKYFGREHGTWKAAALAWYIKDGIETMKRYWAGGFLWGGQNGKGESHLDEFISKNVWQTGYSLNGVDLKTKEHWGLFSQIKVGDEFAIKGYGGRNDLNIYLLGEVESVDRSQGLIKLKKLDRVLYHGKAPSPGGGGSWFGTLLEIVDREAIDGIFYGKEPAMFKHPLNLVLFGPPGTGKTYHTMNHAVAICEDKDLKGVKEEDRHDVAIRFAKLQQEGQVEFVTFHQSMSYEDFVEGIKPDVTGKSGVSYFVKPGVFTSICDRARNNWKASNSVGKTSTFDQVWSSFVTSFEESGGKPVVVKTAKAAFKVLDIDGPTIRFEKQTGKSEHSLCVKTVERLYDNPEQIDQFSSGLRYYYKGLVDELRGTKVEKAHGSVPLKKYVLVIDEINRGNVSAILGELITLLEEDKRLGNDETELQVTLPYSKEPFGVPPNLHVIGTMNTADRSVEALDTALRRRFCFEEMVPDQKLLRANVEAVDLQKLLEAINKRLEVLVDRDHMIGHAFFMKVQDIETLKQVFHYKVMPLLQEYFYGDWSKIYLVLGGSFVQEKTVDGTVSWPKGAERPSESESKTLWTITPYEQWTADTFKQVYEGVEG